MLIVKFKQHKKSIKYFLLPNSIPKSKARLYKTSPANTGESMLYGRKKHTREIWPQRTGDPGRHVAPWRETQGPAGQDATRPTSPPGTRRLDAATGTHAGHHDGRGARGTAVVRPPRQGPQTRKTVCEFVRGWLTSLTQKVSKNEENHQ